MVSSLELDQIQGTVLRNRPMPYVGAYLLFRLDDPDQARTLLCRLVPHVTSAANWQNPEDQGWLNVVFTHDGLRQLGVGDATLDGFPREFRVPMRHRNTFLGDIGESDPVHWDMPEGGSFHVGLLLMAPDRSSFEEKLAIGDEAMNGLGGVRRVSRLDLSTPADHREHFGFVDGISRPFIDGEGGTPKPGQGDPAPAGEFLLGYTNELGSMATGPGPEQFWRNGTYLSIRKLHQKVALFRRYLAEQAADIDGQELLAAKMIGRWRSGCPLALSPDHDKPELADDPMTNNAFAYYDDDPRGLKTPVGAHIRRVNPRDSLQDSLTNARLHRLLRRGSAYGPMLPEGVMDDDGVSRGSMLAFVNADPARQFEFVQSQWVNDGNFVSAGTSKDPVVGNHNGDGDYRYPAKPFRKHLAGLPTFVVTKGGENVFLPSIRCLQGLATGEW
jgi:Dyp-type peroxidase family